MKKAVAAVMQVTAMLTVVAALALVGFVLVIAAGMATPGPPGLMLRVAETATYIGLLIVLLTVTASITNPRWRKAAASTIAGFAIFLAVFTLVLAVQQG